MTEQEKKLKRDELVGRLKPEITFVDLETAIPGRLLRGTEARLGKFEQECSKVAGPDAGEDFAALHQAATRAIFEKVFEEEGCGG